MLLITEMALLSSFISSFIPYFVVSHFFSILDSLDPDRVPHLSPFHQLLSEPASQDALNARLQPFNTQVCRDCQFRKLRTLNLLQVDPSTSSIPVRIHRRIYLVAAVDLLTRVKNSPPHVFIM